MYFFITNLPTFLILYGYRGGGDNGHGLKDEVQQQRGRGVVQREIILVDLFSIKMLWKSLGNVVTNRQAS